MRCHTGSSGGSNERGFLASVLEVVTMMAASYRVAGIGIVRKRRKRLSDSRRLCLPGPARLVASAEPKRSLERQGDYRSIQEQPRAPRRQPTLYSFGAAVPTPIRSNDMKGSARPLAIPLDLVRHPARRATLPGVLQNDAAPMIIDKAPFFDLFQGSKAAEASIVIVEAAIAQARRFSRAVDILHCRAQLLGFKLNHTCNAGSG